ncbi:MAG TPA: hypothetical protein VHC49_16105 [Mycobacteriales bacterium]|nr:hypothetical protein [Mycobacteriales bacterium]
MTSPSYVPPTFLDTPAPVPAGVGRVDLQLDGRTVCSLDVQICPACHRGIFHHVQTEPRHRRHGLAGLAVRTVLDRHADYTWSVAAVPETPAAQALWTTLSGLGVSSPPVTCRHMRAVDDPQDTRRPAAPTPWSSTRR